MAYALCKVMSYTAGGGISNNKLNTGQSWRIRTKAKREEGKGKGPIPMIRTSFSETLRNKEALKVISL